MHQLGYEKMSGFSMQKSSRGFTLIEVLISVAIVGAAVALVLVYQSRAESSERVSNTIFAVANMTAKIRAYYAATGSYSDISPAQVSAMGLVTPPLTSDGFNIYDAWGNNMVVGGNVPGAAPSFVITLGGVGFHPPYYPFSPYTKLSAEECVSLATKLANDADRVNISGWPMTFSTNGLVGSGTAYKAAGNVLSITNLTGAAGCGAAYPMIALQYH